MSLGIHFCRVLLVLCAARTSEAQDAPPSVSAPIHYENLMLMVSDGSRVAAIVVKKETDYGFRYKYRYFDFNTKTESSGEGEVLDKITGKVKDGKVILKSESQPFIVCEKLKLEWSRSDKGKGFIYYSPETLRVQIAHSDDFDKIDLGRFKK